MGLEKVEAATSRRPPLRRPILRLTSHLGLAPPTRCLHVERRTCVFPSNKRIERWLSLPARRMQNTEITTLLLCLLTGTDRLNALANRRIVIHVHHFRTIPCL